MIEAQPLRELGISEQELLFNLRRINRDKAIMEGLLIQGEAQFSADQTLLEAVEAGTEYPQSDYLSLRCHATIKFMLLLSKICPRCKKVARGDGEGFTCITCGWNEYITPDPPKELTGGVPLADKFSLAYKGTNPKYRRVRATIITFLYLTSTKTDRILYFMECPIGSCGKRTAGRKSWESSLRKLDEDFYLFLCTERHLWYLVVLNSEPLYWLTQNLEVDMPTVKGIKYPYTKRGIARAKAASKADAKKTKKKVTRKKY